MSRFARLVVLLSLPLASGCVTANVREKMLSHQTAITNCQTDYEAAITPLVPPTVALQVARTDHCDQVDEQIWQASTSRRLGEDFPKAMVATLVGMAAALGIEGIASAATAYHPTTPAQMGNTVNVYEAQSYGDTNANGYIAVGAAAGAVVAGAATYGFMKLDYGGKAPDEKVQVLLPQPVTSHPAPTGTITFTSGRSVPLSAQTIEVSLDQLGDGVITIAGKPIGVESDRPIAKLKKALDDCAIALHDEKITQARWDAGNRCAAAGWQLPEGWRQTFDHRDRPTR